MSGLKAIVEPNCHDSVTALGVRSWSSYGILELFSVKLESFVISLRAWMKSFSPTLRDIQSSSAVDRVLCVRDLGRLSWGEADIGSSSDSAVDRVLVQGISVVCLEVKPILAQARILAHSTKIYFVSIYPGLYSRVRLSSWLHSSNGYLVGILGIVLGGLCPTLRSYFSSKLTPPVTGWLPLPPHSNWSILVVLGVWIASLLDTIFGVISCKDSFPLKSF